jgi:hypothetical protein
LSQRVTFSPSSSRSLAFVAENTFTPVNIAFHSLRCDFVLSVRKVTARSS